MKKIFFIAPFPPPIHGASLRNQSVADSKLINQKFRIQTFRANQASDVDNIGQFSWNKISQTVADIRKIIVTLRSFKPDLVYFNISLFGFALYRDALYVVIFKIMGYKLLYHLRTQGVRQQVEKSVVKRWLFQYLFNNVAVVCLSRKLYEDIALVYKEEPFIVNNGIAVVEESNTTSFNEHSHICTILFLSNLSILKGIDDFLLALNTLANRAYEFKAQIVGRDYDYTVEGLRERIKKSPLSETTQVLGPLYGSQKLKVLRQADIFVLPTHFEAFPGVILEAMQFGLPVVSTIEGAIPEIVDDGKTGILVSKKDPSALSNAMSSLIDNPSLRKKMGDSGKVKFRGNYTLNVFEQNMAKVFNQVLGEN